MSRVYVEGEGGRLISKNAPFNVFGGVWRTREETKGLGLRTVTSNNMKAPSVVFFLFLFFISLPLRQGRSLLGSLTICILGMRSPPEQQWPLVESHTVLPAFHMDVGPEILIVQMHQRSLVSTLTICVKYVTCLLETGD